ncbi:MAG: peptide chain release factor N(5)-glutamine methyltransferase [Pseudomonadota bacterium]|nr:peptide chain release factor N(5)-glutamine methyltransferase [Pseudomonadota bacterium]
MSDIMTCLKQGAETLAAAEIENPWREARLLLLHATGLTEAVLIGYPERPVEEVDHFTDLVRRRALREPMSHLLGRRQFWSLAFEVTADTLDPRPDSETIIETVLDRIQEIETPLYILDLGTGTGCLLAALLSEYRHAWGIGVERDPGTAKVAQGNFRRLGLDCRSCVVVADWTVPLRGKFDLIVTNPPYIPSADIAMLQPEVAIFEPELALNGGTDGLDAYRKIFPGVSSLLAPGGIVIAEFGKGQEEGVIRLAETAGLVSWEVRTDLAGRPRCLVCTL